MRAGSQVPAFAVDYEKVGLTVPRGTFAALAAAAGTRAEEALDGDDIRDPIGQHCHFSYALRR